MDSQKSTKKKQKHVNIFAQNQYQARQYLRWENDAVKMNYYTWRNFNRHHHVKNCFNNWVKSMKQWAVLR